MTKDKIENQPPEVIVKAPYKINPKLAEQGYAANY